MSIARGGDGRPVQVVVNIEGRPVIAKVWCATAGRVMLYLLDTEVPENALGDQAITQQLYVRGAGVSEK